MFDRQFLAATRHLTERTASHLARRGVRADHLTWAGFGVGLLAVPMIIFGHGWLAILAILLNRVFDGLDGAVARQTRQTDRGAFLDITLDFLFYSAIPLAFGLSDMENNGLAALVLVYAFLGTGTSFLAFAILAARRGMTSTNYPAKGFYYLGGLTEASETIAVFIAMCLFPSWFELLAFTFAGLCAITVIMRISHGLKVFKVLPRKDPTDDGESHKPGRYRQLGHSVPDVRDDPHQSDIFAENSTRRIEEHQD